MVANKTVTTGDGYQYTHFPVFIPGQDHTDGDNHIQQHGQEHTTVPATSVSHTQPTGGDEHHIRLATTHDGYFSHLVLQGRLNSGQYYIRAINQDYLAGSPGANSGEEDVFYVDDVGNIQCGYVNEVDIVALQDLFVHVEFEARDNTEILDAATSADVPGALVLRDAHGDIEAHGLTCNHLFTTGPANQIDIYGDGALRFIPRLPDGSIDASGFYRFGRNTDDLGDTTGSGDGLEFRHHDQEILIQTQAAASFIRMKGDKSSDNAKFIECRNELGDLLFEVNRDGDVQCQNVRCDNIIPVSGEFPTLKVGLLMTHQGSLWLGDHLHCSEQGGRGRLQMRKAAVPTYVAALGGSESNLPAGITLSTATLEHWAAVSVALGGDDNISVIFPTANEHLDFDPKTVVNELLVAPQQKSAANGSFQNTNAGVTIQQPANSTSGQPFIELNGAAGAVGAGMINFQNASVGGSTVGSLFAVKGTGGADPYVSLQVPGGTLNLQATEGAPGVGGMVNVTGKLMCGDINFTGTLTEDGVAFGGGGGPANLSDNELHLTSVETSPTIVRITQDFDDGATANDTARLSLEVMRGSDANSSANCVYDFRVSRGDQGNLYITHRDKFTDVITNDKKLIVYKPSVGHLGLHSMYAGGSHAENAEGVCVKAPLMTWGSVEVGKYGTVANKVLRLYDGVGFETQDANGVNTDVLAEIAANTAFSQAPAQPVLYVQGSASSYNGVVDCAATTRTVMFHSHGSSGDFWLNLPRYADAVDGMTIRVFGGHTTGTGKAFIRTHYLDVAIESNYGLYESSTNLTNGQYSIMPLKQTQFTCVYHDLHKKWWVMGHSTA